MVVGGGQSARSQNVNCSITWCFLRKFFLLNFFLKSSTFLMVRIKFESCLHTLRHYRSGCL